MLRDPDDLFDGPIGMFMLFGFPFGVVFLLIVSVVIVLSSR